MAKQSNQKLKLLYLLKILFEQTDENSGLTIPQIITELAKYNISAARKSLYDDIESLRVFGVDVKVKRDRYVKYYLANREVSSVEFRYLIDALNGFDAISQSLSYELVERLIRKHGLKGRDYSEIVVEPLYKTPKAIYDEISKSIELLDNAILNKKKIYCKQFTWNSEKQRTFLDGGRRLCLTPIRLACDGKYLLYAYDGEKISVYDVDGLIDVEVSSESAAPYDEYRELLTDPRYDAEYDNLRLECRNSFAGEVFAKFGLGVTVLARREETFEITVKVKLDDALFAWLFNNAKHVKIVSPVRVREMYKEMVLLALQNVDQG